MNRYAIIEAPSILGLKPTGVDRLPTVLLQHGLADELHARRAGRVVPTAAYDTERDPESLTLNARGIAEYSVRLADTVAEVVGRGEFPILLGGDCSILLGSSLALRRRGRYGLLFIDGHADFYQPEANPNGEAASMDLAFATGRGPELLTNLEGLRPLVRDEDVVAFGFRDAEEQRQYGSQPLPPQVLALDLSEVRRLGTQHAAQRAVEYLTAAERPTRGFFIHLDADVVSDDLMPAVDYRMPDGLSWEELRTVLGVALGSGRAVGIEITIYNPALDASGASGRDLARTLIKALQG
ncbi:MAG TPA: arginase family protein [Steroidobacteraceae bacterium]|nr:arginase family protein [Steroidobacteraceae bacterium]